MTLYDLRLELIAIATEAETPQELIGALEELLARVDKPENAPCRTTVAAIVSEVA